MDLEKLDNLKTMLPGDEPCLSVYMNLSNASTAGRNPNGKQDELRWRECLQKVEEQIPRFGDAGRKLVNSVREWTAVESDVQTRMGQAVAVFRSANVSRVIHLDCEIGEEAILGRQFHIRPLLKDLVHTKSFYLLALSQKNTRLLHCTMHSSEEVALPPSTRTDYEEWLNMAKPDHNAIYNAMAAGAQGASGPTALAPWGADDSAKDEKYLTHFCKQIAAGVAEALRGKTEPLVLCAVEYEQPIYREVNIYPHLAAESVQGAPNSLKSGEMHARAIEALHRCYDKKVDDVLAEWNHKVGGGASSHLNEVVLAAHDGRVLTLLASDSQAPMGFFDEATHSVKGSADEPRRADLVNDAAVQTILHAGRVFVVPQKKMPNGVAAAAIYRF